MSAKTLPSRLAVFSDVHSNLEALEAVLEDMASLGLTKSFCLGDIVGYAADPSQCLEKVRALGCPILQGNHDAAVAEDVEYVDVSDTAAAGFRFSRKKLTAEQRLFLKTLPLTLAGEGMEFVHASLDEPPKWYYVIDIIDARHHFRKQQASLCFCGHTHEPMLWKSAVAGRAVSSLKGTGIMPLPDSGKVLVNVGSVGQPRDGNPLACYVVYDLSTRTVEFRRVAYDIKKAQRKIRNAGLPRFTAKRLADGG